MNIVYLSFALAIRCVANLPVMIEWSPMVLGLPIALFRLVMRAKGLSEFFIGLTYSLWTASERLDGELHERLEGIDLEVQGIIVELPRDSPSSHRFRFRVERSVGDPFDGDVMLSCYRWEQRFVPGDI